jgi:phosphatidylglycerol---prolipoprotein diacylglyceryl transferase
LDAYLFFKIAGILAFVLGGTHSAKKAGIPPKKAFFVLFWAVLAGFSASRLWYIVQHTFGSELYAPADPLEAWNDAGSILYGWILGGAAAIVFLTRKWAIPTVAFFDRILPWMLVAQILNRFGCFAGECCWGAPTAFFLSVWNSHEGALVHPVQLYEAAFDAALLWLMCTHAKRPGEATYLYFMGYSMGRFFLEFLRGDNGPALLFFTVPQVTALAVMAYMHYVWKRPSSAKPR